MDSIILAAARLVDSEASDIRAEEGNEKLD
jgi:hypothetical protein